MLGRIRIREPNVDRDQQIAVAQLHRVAGVVDDRQLRVLCPLGKGAHGREHFVAPRVLHQERVEADALQHRGHRRCVMWRVGERRYIVAVRAVADDQSDPAGHRAALHPLPSRAAPPMRAPAASSLMAMEPMGK